MGKLSKHNREDEPDDDCYNEDQAASAIADMLNDTNIGNQAEKDTSMDTTGDMPVGQTQVSSPAAITPQFNSRTLSTATNAPVKFARTKSFFNLPDPENPEFMLPNPPAKRRRGE